MKHSTFSIVTVTVYLIIGFITGVIWDKEWLTDTQLHYVQELKKENHLLVQEKQAWASYVKDEINDIKIYTTADHEQFQKLNNTLAAIGVTLEKIPETMSVYQQKGVIISLGEELEETYGLPHLTLKTIPEHDVDLNLMYLSLLRLKEELIK